MFYFPSITYLMEQQVEHLQEVCGAVAYPSRLDEVGEGCSEVARHHPLQ